MTQIINMIDIEKATHNELLNEYEKCEDLWGKYSCDCFGFYMSALHKKISKHKLGFKKQRRWKVL